LADVDILEPSDRRRIWIASEKAALLAEIDAEGGKVRLVARRHGISESLLYNWRSARKAAAVAMGAPETVEFIPAGIIGRTPPPNPAMLPSRCAASRQAPVRAKSKAGSIEIVLANGVLVRVDTGVDEAALLRVLRSIRGTPPCQ
jgi:transposase-like protein